MKHTLTLLAILAVATALIWFEPIRFLQGPALIITLMWIVVGGQYVVKRRRNTRAGIPTESFTEFAEPSSHSKVRES